MNREIYLKNIADNLALLSLQVEIRNEVSLFDINIIAEDFYPGLLNIILEKNFVNANNSVKNAAGIDLVDDTNRVSIQVTSDNSSDKIKHTIDEFIKHESYKKYDRLIVLILTNKKGYTTTFDTEGKFVFNKNEDIWDVKDLISMIRPLSIDRLRNINDFLQKELYDKCQKEKSTEASEVDTIIDLIEFISNNRKIAVAKDVVIDPEYKLNRRFKEFADSITSQYLELLSIYGTPLHEIEKQRGDEALDIITKIYLQDISVEFLDKSDNNPIKALEELTKYFSDKLSSNGKKYDRAAIKFYLVDKMIKCSVFPNERSEYIVS